jgi:hypothetical protein
MSWVCTGPEHFAALRTSSVSLPDRKKFAKMPLKVCSTNVCFAQEKACPLTVVWPLIQKTVT